MYSDLIRDKDFTNELKSRALWALSDKEKQELWKILEAQCKQHNEPHFERLRQLFNAFVERWHAGDENLGLPYSNPEDYFLLAESPELMTEKEFLGILEDWKARVGGARVLIERFAGTYPRPIVQCRQAVRRAIALRNRLITQMVDEALGTREEDYIDRILEVGEFVREMCEVEYPGDPERYVLDVPLFERLLAHAVYWAHFSSELYRDLRSQERSILIIAICNVEDKDKHRYLDALRPWPGARRPISEEERAFEPLRQELTDSLVGNILDSLEQRFLEPGFARLCWQEQCLSLRWLLLDSTSPFFERGLWNRLLSTLESRAGEEEVRSNCYEYLTGLFAAATEVVNPVDPNHALRVFRDYPEFAEKLWEIATAARLNRRHWGTLKQYRGTLRSRLEKPDLFPDPPWAVEGADGAQ